MLGVGSVSREARWLYMRVVNSFSKVQMVRTVIKLITRFKYVYIFIVARDYIELCATLCIKLARIPSPYLLFSLYYKIQARNAALYLDCSHPIKVETAHVLGYLIFIWKVLKNLFLLISGGALITS